MARKLFITAVWAVGLVSLGFAAYGLVSHQAHFVFQGLLSGIGLMLADAAVLLSGKANSIPNS